jgi:polyisoprenoid-binding protein YceI
MQRQFLAALALLGALHAARAAEYNAVQADKGALGFVFKQMNVPVEGRFKRFSTQLSFDPAKPQAARVVLDIDLASIDAGSAEANDEVVGKSWLNAKQFPRARFESTGVKALGGNRYEVTGNFTLKGKTQVLVVPVVFKPEGNVASYSGSLTIRRADYAVGEGVWAAFDTVANEIQVSFRGVATAASGSATKPASK